MNCPHKSDILMALGGPQQSQFENIGPLSPFYEHIHISQIMTSEFKEFPDYVPDDGLTAAELVSGE